MKEYGVHDLGLIYGEYLRINEDEAIEFVLTGKIGETLIECPECRKKLLERQDEQ